MTTAAHPRLDNLLAALTLNLAEDTTAAMERSGGLTGRAIQALLALEEFLGGCHVGKLAEVLDLTHSGAVRLVSQLEDAGYAERRPGADRRRVEVVLTARGRRQAAGARRAQLAVIRQATDGLDAAEAATLERLLARLVESRVGERFARRAEGDSPAWWCRTCDFASCGRGDGRCPAQTTAARLAGS
ncbi:MarR family winged helix-turn-helix transcriptional regulator [Flexivirga oryzae]|uniref:DNA-binding MarR family transcriptional regulator n=1 Tax=Flexivirga oryzae TaxID=1794944 RepID=A0A839NEC9_9MICO|nr:MarR family winged helix-turn-helix transcriptional regulator [Flexivirga oryzae]MBB2894673.1 DNA-binding MarR family transcriptional regulator [Flexivirga oryzae]